MSQANNNIGASFLETQAVGTIVNTAPDHRLGTRMRGANGSEWVFVRATSAITDAGYVVVISPAWQAVMATNTTAVYGQQLGVAGVAFATNDYGWVQIYGTANIRVSASAAANVRLASTVTAGEIDDAVGTGTKLLNGIALTTARGGTAGTAEGVLNHPTVFTTNA